MALNISSRTNQYALLPYRESLVGQRIIYVVPADFSLKTLTESFDSLQFVQLINLSNSKTMMRPYHSWTGILKQGIMQ